MSQKFKIFGSKFMVEEELRALHWSELVANAVVVLDYEETGEEEISQEAKSSICQS